MAIHNSEPPKRSNRIQMMEESVWLCLNYIQRQNAIALSNDWQKNYESQPEDVLAKVLSIQFHATEAKRSKAFDAAKTNLAAVFLFFFSQKDYTRAIYALLDIADIAADEGYRTFAEITIASSLSFTASDTPISEPLIRNTVGLLFLWLIGLPIAYSDFEDAKKRYIACLKLVPVSARNAIRTTDGFKIAKIWMDAIKKANQSVLRTLETELLNLPEENLLTLSDILNIWTANYLVIRNARERLSRV